VAGELEASSVLPAILEVRSLYDQCRSTKTLITIKPRCFVLSHSFIFFWFHSFIAVCIYGCMFCMLLFVYIMYFYCYVYVLFFLSLCILIVMHVLFWVFCFIVLLCALFECKRALYYCHRVSTQLQLKYIIYHIISHNIIHFIRCYMLIGPYFHSKYLNSCF